MNSVPWKRTLFYEYLCKVFRSSKSSKKLSFMFSTERSTAIVITLRNNLCEINFYRNLTDFSINWNPNITTIKNCYLVEFSGNGSFLLISSQTRRYIKNVDGFLIFYWIIMNLWPTNIRDAHCVKYTRIRGFSDLYFPYMDRLCPFTGKYRS